MDQVRPLIANDLAADIAGLLASGAQFDGRPLIAGDIAVLVNTHAQAAQIREALAVHDVPSVTAGAGSVSRPPPGTAGSPCWRRWNSPIDPGGSAPRP